MRYKVLWGGLCSFLLLLSYLHVHSWFHLYAVEQNQMFLDSRRYFLEELVQPGGFANWIAGFLMQFFVYLYVGAIITSFLIIGVGLVSVLIIKQIAPKSGVEFLGFLPAIMLLFLHFDLNYQMRGSIGYLLVLIIMLGYIRIGQFYVRLLYTIVISPILYWLLGPVALLFAVTLFLYECLKYTPHFIWITLPFIEVCIVAFACVYIGKIGEFRFAFLPDMYYHEKLQPQIILYYTWLCLPVLLFIAFRLKKRKDRSERRQITEDVFQIFVLLFLFVWGVYKYSYVNAAFLKKLDYYASSGQWDQIIKSCEGSLNNFLYINYLNMALAQKGELADNMFSYDQKGLKGLVVGWNKTSAVSTLLSDIYYTMGHISLAQEMAFEANICFPEKGSPRLLKRLIETNLILGAYPVAEKYISILEQTFYYKDWAKECRKFLYNDEAIENDPILGSKRKCLPSENHLALIQGLPVDLMIIAEHNPENVAAMQYLGAYYLLSKDMDAFQKMIERYYGTEVLPVLPKSYQEAVIVYTEKNPEYRKRYGVSDAVLQRYAGYRKEVLANQNNVALAEIMQDVYGDTYWYYYMFKQ